MLGALGIWIYHVVKPIAAISVWSFHTLSRSRYLQEKVVVKLASAILSTPAEPPPPQAIEDTPKIQNPVANMAALTAQLRQMRIEDSKGCLHFKSGFIEPAGNPFKGCHVARSEKLKTSEKASFFYLDANDLLKEVYHKGSRIIQIEEGWMVASPLQTLYDQVRWVGEQTFIRVNGKEIDCSQSDTSINSDDLSCTNFIFPAPRLIQAAKEVIGRDSEAMTRLLQCANQTIQNAMFSYVWNAFKENWDLHLIPLSSIYRTIEVFTENGFKRVKMSIIGAMKGMGEECIRCNDNEQFGSYHCTANFNLTTHNLAIETYIEINPEIIEKYTPKKEVNQNTVSSTSPQAGAVIPARVRSLLNRISGTSLRRILLDPT